MVDEIPDGSFVVLNLFRKRQGFSDPAGNPLTKRVVEALNITGFARLFADRFVAFGGQNLGIGLPEIRMDKGALAIHCRQGVPQLLSRFRRAISHGATHDLAAVFVLGQPDPDLLHLGAHK